MDFEIFSDILPIALISNRATTALLASLAIETAAGLDADPPP